MFAFLAGLYRRGDAVLSSIRPRRVTVTWSLFGTVPLVDGGLGRAVLFREPTSLRGERDLVFDTGTIRVHRSDVNLCLRNLFHGLLMGILSRWSSKGDGIGRETVELTSLDMLLNTRGFRRFGRWFLVAMGPQSVGA